VKQYWYICLIAIIMTGLFFCSCSQSNPPASPTTVPVAPTSKIAQSSATPQTGGILKIAKQNSPTNIGNPPLFASDRCEGRAAIESLLTVSSDGKGTLLPQLATAWKYNTEYTNLTLTLRQGVKFHDGTDFNADAAKFSLDLTRNSPAGSFKNVSSIDVVDNYTVRMNLSSYEPTTLDDLSTIRYGAIVSPTAYKAMAKDEPNLRPVGTGPFKFVSYQRDVALKFTKFDGYWQKGRPYLDGVEYYFAVDPMTRTAMLKTGDVQILGDSPQTNDVVDLQKANYKATAIPSSVYGFIGDSGHADSPYSKIQVRQATAYAIDNKAITSALGYGFFQETNQLASKANWYYNPQIAGYPYNPAKAKQLLAEAGYPNGFQTTIYLESAGVIPQLFAAVQAYFKEVGINAKLEVLDRNASTDKRTKGWTNSLVWFWPKVAVIDGDPGTQLKICLSSKGSSYDPKSLFIPADYDSLLTQANAERDSQKRVTMFQQLEKMIIDQYCLAVPVYVSAVFSIASPVVQGSDYDSYDGGNAWTPENIWLSKK
jgi:peptide/nickel transport system substrate-binding protein